MSQIKYLKKIELDYSESAAIKRLLEIISDKNTELGKLRAYIEEIDDSLKDKEVNKQAYTELKKELRYKELKEEKKVLTKENKNLVIKNKNLVGEMARLKLSIK